MNNHEEFVTQAKAVVEYLVNETSKEKQLKTIVRDLRDKLIEIDKDLNDDTDSAFEQAVDKAFDKVVDKVDDYVPGASKKFILISVGIMLAVLVGLIYITY